MIWIPAWRANSGNASSIRPPAISKLACWASAGVTMPSTDTTRPPRMARANGCNLYERMDTSP
ncbi:hypothetical protein D3C72_2206740 [compost metagenome]